MTAHLLTVLRERGAVVCFALAVQGENGLAGGACALKRLALVHVVGVALD